MKGNKNTIKKGCICLHSAFISMNEVLNAVLINVFAPKSKLKLFSDFGFIRVCVTLSY